MLEFTKDFFEGEEREGFYIDNEVKRVWATEIDILMEIDRICQKHGIQYFADYGTLLGAVRHKGYIPWDDDLDICMKRTDYQKFHQIAQQELSKDFGLQSLYLTPNYSYPFMKVLNGSDIIGEKRKIERFYGSPYVVGVDIFPLDYLPQEENEFDVLKTLYGHMYEIKEGLKSGVSLEKMESLIQYVEEYLNYHFDRNGDMINQILRLLEHISVLYRAEESLDLGNMGFVFCQGEKKRSKEWYKESIMMPFENIQIPVPIGYDEVLTALYGDYMVRVRNTASHDYPFWKDQKQKLEKFGFNI